MSGDVFSAKIGSLRSELKKTCEFIPIDGPFEVLESESGDASSRHAKGRSWYDFKSIPGHYGGMEEAISCVGLAIGPNGADGVIGFSQGSIVAALWAARAAATPHTLPESMRGLRFVVLASGALPSDQTYADEILAASPLLVPSIHSFGEGDAIVEPVRSQRLANLFEGAVVVTHSGGHVIPSSFRKPLRAFIDKLAAA